jgi:hypothetical protein
VTIDASCTSKIDFLAMIKDQIWLCLYHYKKLPLVNTDRVQIVIRKLICAKNQEKQFELKV